MTRSMNLSRPMVRFTDRRTNRQSIGRIVDRMRTRANVSLVTEIEETAEKRELRTLNIRVETKGREKSGEEEGRKERGGEIECAGPRKSGLEICAFFFFRPL